jgi:hypothetical protein
MQIARATVEAPDHCHYCESWWAYRPPGEAWEGRRCGPSLEVHLSLVQCDLSDFSGPDWLQHN